MIALNSEKVPCFFWCRQADSKNQGGDSQKNKTRRKDIETLPEPTERWGIWLNTVAYYADNLEECNITKGCERQHSCQKSSRKFLACGQLAGPDR